MARAYIVSVRNDLDEKLLQVVDLKPNSSQFSPAYDGQNSGQTGYLPPWLLDGVNNDGPTGGVQTTVGVNITINGDMYGLSTYLICKVEDSIGGGAILAGDAADISGGILGAAAAGTALDIAAINAIILAVTGGINGIGIGNSDATVEEILRICAGERFKAADGLEVQNAGGVWTGPGLGDFVSRPNVENPASVQGTYGGVRGRSSTAPAPYFRSGEVRAGQTPVQTGTQDVLFRDVRSIVDAGGLQLSALSGALADLKSASFVHLNPDFTYGAGGTAITGAAAVVPVTGVARAITIYDVLGNVI